MLGRLARVVRRWAHARFEEPVVVMESDDWGMYRAPASSSAIRQWGTPSEWAFDRLETPQELTALYEVLRRYKDALGSPPKIVANMITAKPDFHAMQESGYSRLILTPLRQLSTELLERWKLGLAEGLFVPQYHGRLHYNAEQFIRELQESETSRSIFEAGWHGGLSNLKESGWCLHSEYLHWGRGKDVERETLKAWVAEGLQEFRDVFGFSSQSTIAPHYVFSPLTAAVWAELGIKCVQGCNMQMYKKKGRAIRENLPIGSTKYAGLIAISRNVKFEPSRGHKDWLADSAVESAEYLISRRIPVIVDSHRINYVSSYANAGLAALDALLSGLSSLGVRYLTSFELAEAISANGRYTDFATGAPRSLTPLGDSRAKRLVRRLWR